MQFPLATGNVLASRYLVERLLGAGGMSVVAVATDLTEGQRVAIKMLLPESARSDAVIKRFQREQRTLQQLSSPHTVRLIAAGTEGGYPYMVLEYLEGSDLSDVLKMQGALPAPEAAEYILHACEAIAEAHSLGITHRDLKPGNLFMIRQPNGSACIKVLDFGISKLHETARQGESTLTGTAALLGSPFYMSPEQLISSRDVDARTDIWSLGVTLHELLTSALPFGAKTTEKVCKRILNDVPTPLRQFRPDLPQGLEALILRCLKRRPAERYPTVGELAADLAPFAPPAAGRQSLRAIAELLQPTNRVRAKAATDGDERAAATARRLPRAPAQGRAVDPAAPGATAAPPDGRAPQLAPPAMLGPPMGLDGASSSDGNEATAVLTVGAAASALAFPSRSGAEAQAKAGVPAATPAGGAVGAAGPAVEATLAAAAGLEAATLHVPSRGWSRAVWIAASSSLATITFALGLATGLGVAGPSSEGSARASALPGTLVSACPPVPSGPKPASETRELDEGLDPLPDPGRSAAPVPTSVSQPEARPDSGEKSPARPPSPSGTDSATAVPTRATAPATTTKAPAATATGAKAPGVSETPDF